MPVSAQVKDELVRTRTRVQETDKLKHVVRFLAGGLDVVQKLSDEDSEETAEGATYQEAEVSA